VALQELTSCCCVTAEQPFFPVEFFAMASDGLYQAKIDLEIGIKIKCNCLKSIEFSFGEAVRIRI
jgi:hypothetical protein